MLAASAVMAILAGRLAWIQLVAAESYSSRHIDLVAASVAQREFGIELDSGRGHFYDRHGQALTGQKVQALIVFPVRRREPQEEEKLAKLPQILGVGQEEWNRFFREADTPKMWKDSSGQPIPLAREQALRIAELAIPGVEVMETTIRYPKDAAAKHVIGYVGENPERIETVFADQLARGLLSLTSKIGAAGLEKTMESYLRGAGKTSVSLFTDAAKRPLAGLDVRLVQPGNPYYPMRVNTTLDRGIQAEIERIMDRAGIVKGAAVVLDVKNADVVAMASRPDFDPYRIKLEDGDWGNKALKAAVPGSIFKTAVAAAALEHGKVHPDETFYCSGSYGKYGLRCWLPGGHGRISFREAYAHSCNIAFAAVAERLSGEEIQEIARGLGLDRTVGWTDERKGWPQFDHEEAGQIFAGQTPSEDEGVRVQTSIGQRDVLVTPLQAANLVVALLNGGEVKSPRVVRDVRYRTGTVAFSFPERNLEAEGKEISPNTAKTIADWMRDVVEEGTGKALKQTKWPVAGKSGTAQVTVNGKDAVNQWFIGYGPADHPQYAVAVVAQEEPVNGPNKSVAAFGRIMDLLAGHPL